MTPGLWLVLAYLLGSVPCSYIAGRMTRGIDLREHGSGNLGATNTFRVLGPRVAAPVMVFDILKGFVPTYFFVRWDGSPLWTWALAYGAAAILGHVFSIYMRFRGGKGVASAAGVFLALSPVAVLFALLVWLGVLAGSKMVSLASISAAVTLIVALVFTESRPAVMALGMVVAAFIIYAHRSNIGRILRGEEHRFGRARADTRPLRGKETP